MNEEACYTIKTRAAYHYLSENNKIERYNDYLEGKITRLELYNLVPSEVLDSILNIEINDNSIDSIFSNKETQTK